MTWSRRKVLGGLGAVAAAGLFGRPRAEADVTRVLQGAKLNCKTYKVLEIFMQGGLSHRETLWVENPDQAPVWRELFNVTPGSWASTVTGVTPLPSTGWVLPVTANVGLGPCGIAIHGHTIASRMRLVATGHALDPHEGAGALTLTGLPFGRTRGAGLGTVIQRKYGTASNPVSFVIAPSYETLYNTYMTEAGVHGPANRPVLLRLNGTMTGDLARSSIAPAYKPAVNGLLEYYEGRYDGRLIYPGGGPARSTGHDAYSAALRRLIDAPTLQAALASAPSLYVSNSPLTDVTPGRRAIAIGCHLLQQGARYAGVIDHGAVEGYDTHFVDYSNLAEHAIKTNGNVYHLLKELRDQVDAGVLDLDETIVVLRSEFGRVRNDLLIHGTNHWPKGYCTLLIGGPLTSSGVSGGMNFPSTTADGSFATGGPSGDPISPTDLRAALLIAAGINPFDPDCLLINETSMDGGTAAATRAHIVQHVLGLSPSLLTVPCPIVIDPDDMEVL